MRSTLPAVLIALATTTISCGAAHAQNAPAQTENAQVVQTGSAAATPTGHAADAPAASAPTTTIQSAGVTHTHVPDPVPPATEQIWQAEAWAKNRNSPWLTPADSDVEKKKHKGPVRSFVKSVAKGTAKELGTSMHDMARDMVFVFSVQDIDPYEQKGVPANRPAIVLKFTMVDGTSCFLRRFPDGSYAIEDGFADGTVLLPRKETGDYLVNYPNGFQGRMVKASDGNITIYRPDKTETKFTKNASGGYTATNTKLGYLGEARPDTTGVQYEVGAW
ncbi:MAG: hypothetical protein SGJ27_21540 [Candidatus Melainabacteria bacterium]|nr:hypothetical protein [Candidatus Melainabacteria bacterium]